MAAPTLYRASDSGAPQMDGTAGSLVNVLTACLVNGYGSKAAAGWTRSFSATNQAVYRQAAGNQFYLDVDDRGASGVLTGASGQEAAVRGYESMSAVSTGTNPFPTAAQIAVATANWRKSSAATSVPRGWWMLADDRTFYLGIDTKDSINQPAYFIYFFGDIYSLKSADGFRTAINVKSAVNVSSTSGLLGAAYAAQNNGVVSGFYIARVQAGTGTSQNGGTPTLASNQPVTASFNDGANPSPDGNMYLSRVMVTDAAPPYLRGYMRGLWVVQNPVATMDGDVVSGTGDLSTKTFVLIGGIASTGSPRLAFETTAWDTST